MLDQVAAATDRFLEKAQRENKPFQTFLETEVYQRFYNLIKSGLMKQARFCAKELRSLNDPKYISDDYQPMSDDQIAQLRAWIKRQPTIGEYIAEQKIFVALREAFEWSAKAQYQRWGLLVKADTVDFNLTNQMYIGQLKAQANYLLNKSLIDETTTEELISLIRDGKLNALTIDEIADDIVDAFDSISDKRAFVISRTETAQAMGSANYATMVENGVTTKRWVTAGSKPCEICIGNEDDGDIKVNEAFSSGDMFEPAHPNDECYTEAGEIDLDSIDIWGGE